VILLVHDDDFSGYAVFSQSHCMLTVEKFGVKGLMSCAVGTHRKACRSSPKRSVIFVSFLPKLECIGRF
jgi:hypothetical protein